MGGTDGTNLRMLAVSSAGIASVIGTAGEAHLGEIGGRIVTSEKEFTRPADTTAYASGDCVSSSTSAPATQELTSAARVSGGSGYITGIVLSKSTASTTAVPFRIWFFNSTRTPTNDNSALVLAYTDKSSLLGYADVNVVGTSGFTCAFGIENAARLPFVSSGTSLWYVLQVLGSYTPGNAETFNLKIRIDQN